MVYEELIISDIRECDMDCSNCYLKFKCFESLEYSDIDEYKKNLTEVFTKYKFAENTRITFYHQLNRKSYNKDMRILAKWIKENNPNFITEIVTPSDTIANYYQLLSLNYDEITLSSNLLLQVKAINNWLTLSSNKIKQVIWTFDSFNNINDFQLNEVKRIEGYGIKVLHNAEKPMILSSHYNKYLDRNSNIPAKYENDVCFYKQIVYNFINSNVKNKITLGAREGNSFIMNTESKEKIAIDLKKIATSGFGATLTYFPNGEDYNLSQCPYYVDSAKKNEITKVDCSKCKLTKIHG